MIIKDVKGSFIEENGCWESLINTESFGGNWAFKV